MRRVLVRWRGLMVWSYPAMLYLGLVFGTVAASFDAHSTGLDPLRVWIATILLVIPALVGASALFLLIMLRYASARLLLELAREHGNQGRQFRVAYAFSVVFVLTSIAMLILNW